MSKPEVRETITGYDLQWKPENITIRASRLQAHSSDGRVTGEIIISRTGNDRPIYPPTSVNFSSDRTRSSLIKTLSDLDNEIDWSAIINQLSVAIIERAREGEPVRELWTNATDIEPPKFVLEPLLYEGLPTIIFGEKAVCKSTISIAIYACLILPWTDNTLGWRTPEKSTIPLLCDYEADYKIAQYNAKRLQQGMNLTPFPVYHRRCTLPLADDIEQLKRHIDRIGATAIIIDSLGPAVGGDLKEASQALRFTTAVRQLNCSTLVIGQTSKDRENKHKSVFGSTYFEYYARNLYELRKVQEEGEDDIDLALYNTYCNLGRRTPAQGFHISFTDQGTRIESQAITAPELVERLGTQNRILKALREEPIGAKELAEMLGIASNTVRQSLKRMKSKGLVIKVDDRWGIVDKDV